jgi:uncharacterized protein YggE
MTKESALRGKLFDDCVQDLLHKAKLLLSNHGDTWTRVMPGYVVASIQEEVTDALARAVKEAHEKAKEETGPKATVVR